MRGVLQEIVAAIRRLKRQRAFAGTVVIILTIGLSAMLAVVALLRATAFKPIPWPEVNRLTLMMMLENGVPEPMSATLAAQLRDLTADDINVSWFSAHPEQTTDPEQTVRVAAVGPAFFNVLGIGASRGRVFDSRETDAAGVVVLSARAARTLFAAEDPLDQELTLGERRLVVVGVLAPGSGFPSDAEAWVADATASASGDVELIGRLRPTRPMEAVRSLSSERLAALRSGAVASGTAIALSITPFLDVARPSLSRRARVIILGVAAVFIVMLVNVSVLIILRTERERAATATRVALGASVWRLVRTAGIEIGVLVVAAAGIAFTVGAALFQGVIGQVSGPMELVNQGNDASFALILIALTVLVTMVLAVGPLLRIRSASPLDAMRGSGGISGRRASRLRQFVLIAQLTATTTLVSLGAAVGIAFVRVATLDFGFAHENIVFGTVNFESSALRRPEEAKYFARQFLERTKRITAGSPVAIWSTTYPRRHASQTEAPIAIEGRELPAQDASMVPVLVVDVSPSYFSTLEIARLRGRLFSAEDQEGSEGVTIIDSLLAERLWPGRDALGQWIRVGGAESGLPWLRVVGVVASAQPVHELTLEWQSGGQRYPIMYRPFSQGAAGRLVQPLEGTGFSVAVKSAQPAAGVTRSLENLLAEMAPNERFTAIGGLQQFIDRTDRLNETRFESAVFLVFGVIGLLLALVGVIAFVDEVVTTRTREIGVRMALGASPKSIVAIMSRQTLLSAFIGCLLGAAGVFAASGPIASMLRLNEGQSGVQSTILPLFTVAIVATVVLFMSGAAALLRASKAARVNPSVALRVE